MAADSERPPSETLPKAAIAADATNSKPEHPASNSADAPSTTSTRNNERKYRGEKGRNAARRDKVGDKRKAQRKDPKVAKDPNDKANDWREIKRRKTDKNGNEFVKETPNPFSAEEIAAEGRRPKRKVAVLVGYAGTGYRGMQMNGDDKTIERDLFQAFIDASAISKANADDARKSSLSRCARTDKGVHAAGNVISLKLILDDGVLDKINAALPEQIRVWGILRTNNTFNCYQLCDSRWYEYLLPSYSLLPPHPKTFLGQKLVELSKEYGGEEEMNAKLADVKDFWKEVEENEIKPILAKLDPEVRAKVMEKLFAEEDEEANEEAPSSSSNKGNEAPSSSSNDKMEQDAQPQQQQQEQQQTGSAEGEQKIEKETVVLETHQPKGGRTLTPVDYALRDVKAAYISAKRRYRISPERLNQLQTILNEYKGTRNFHNYTVQKAHSDPSAKRLIKSFVVNPKPIIIHNTEWLSLKVHGQSFMMHQIRKMVGLATLMVRCGTPLERVAESYEKTKMAIPKAPGLGLLLERPVFANYNRRATETLNREELDFGQYEEQMDKFKEEQIYTRIFDVEEKDNWFHGFYNQIDQFKANHFLWLTPGGMAVADYSKDGATEKSLEKKLGDEDENPDGGEG